MWRWRRDNCFITAHCSNIPQKTSQAASLTFTYRGLKTPEISSVSFFQPQLYWWYLSVPPLITWTAVSLNSNLTQAGLHTRWFKLITTNRRGRLRSVRPQSALTCWGFTGTYIKTRTYIKNASGSKPCESAELLSFKHHNNWLNEVIIWQWCGSLVCSCDSSGLQQAACADDHNTMNTNCTRTAAGLATRCHKKTSITGNR